MTNRNNLPLACLPIFIPTNIFLSPSLAHTDTHFSLSFSYNKTAILLFLLLFLLGALCLSSYLTSSSYQLLYQLLSFLLLQYCILPLSLCSNSLFVFLRIYLYPFFSLLLLLQDCILYFFLL